MFEEQKTNCNHQEMLVDASSERGIILLAFLISVNSVWSNTARLSTLPPPPSITQATIALLMQPSISMKG